MKGAGLATGSKSGFGAKEPWTCGQEEPRRRIEPLCLLSHGRRHYLVIVTPRVHSSVLFWCSQWDGYEARSVPESGLSVTISNQASTSFSILTGYVLVDCWFMVFLIHIYSFVSINTHRYYWCFTFNTPSPQMGKLYYPLPCPVSASSSPVEQLHSSSQEFHVLAVRLTF